MEECANFIKEVNFQERYKTEVGRHKIISIVAALTTVSWFTCSSAVSPSVASFNPLVPGKFFSEFLAQIHSIGVIYD